MRFCRERIILSIFLFCAFHISFANAGLNKFTQIDSYKKWVIEQKFDLENDQVFCRASRKGNGTWFSDKIRLGKDDEVILPKDASIENYPSDDDLKNIHIALQRCRAGLIYDE